MHRRLRKRKIEKNLIGNRKKTNKWVGMHTNISNYIKQWCKTLANKIKI